MTSSAPFGAVSHRGDFERLARSPFRASHGMISVRYLPDPASTDVRVAYTVSRHVGGAVVRNTVRRRLRAIARETIARPGCYLILVRNESATASFGQLRDDAVRALSRLFPETASV